MVDPFALVNKRILITGGTRGIGRAISLQFARAGARVLANYVRDQDAARQLQHEAAELGFALQTVRADVASNRGIESLLDCVRGEGRLSGLVHCAATGVHRPLEQLTLRQYDWTFGLNVRAFFELVRRLIPDLDSGSAIVAVSSTGAVRAVPQYGLVGSSKAALEALVRQFAVELAPRGIRVNALAPGSVATDAWKVLPDAERRLADESARSPRGCLNTLDEIATAAHFLCSDAASGILGHTLVVDGGRRIVQ